MRFGSTLVLSTCLLFGAAFAGATPADTPEVTPPVSAPAQAEPSCAASLFPQKGLPFTPSPSPKAGNCGGCSSSSCLGMNINDSCYFLSGSGYALGRCHADSVCPEEGYSTACICRGGPEV